MANICLYAPMASSGCGLHFGMTGSLQYFKNDEQASRYARVLFVFANNHRLAFDDQRQFGEIGLLNDIDEFLNEHALGPDALKIDLREFRKILGKRRGAVKSVLLNQRIIAGIGNIYADEILFRVRMHPATEVSRLGDKALIKLSRATHASAKGDCGESRYDSDAGIMAAATSWKRREMSSLREET